jgi:hypothetical protein
MGRDARLASRDAQRRARGRIMYFIFKNCNRSIGREIFRVVIKVF